MNFVTLFLRDENTITFLHDGDLANAKNFRMSRNCLGCQTLTNKTNTFSIQSKTKTPKYQHL